MFETDNDSDTGEGKRRITAASITTPMPVAATMYFSKSIKKLLKNIKEFFQITGMRNLELIWIKAFNNNSFFWGYASGSYYERKQMA